ncbi:hypothetical protein [Polymorphospora rubra]|uniref:Uncharacterized protein n=1 Tax=Polymorphospora rubra TaxID=338584 RepID=A0A810N9A0_9ACTN|nr:hypothetical protein [Polymorphospora rubra]BCJ70441.1 hypothetical protein Prubr_74620 [Polymorphospora rubra]
MNRLAALAETAHQERDPDKASMVFNGAALVASDCGDTELARAWCHRHANLYLGKVRLNSYTARFALEPIINLARLRIRAGDSDGAYRMLTDLHKAVLCGNRTAVDDLEIHPRQLPTDPSELEQIIKWLRGVLLSDGTRALTLAGRWTDALNHVHRYDGIGPNLLDGRQIAVAVHLIQGDTSSAATFLDQAKIEQPWERPVHDLLQHWHALTVGAAPTTNPTDLINRTSPTPEALGLAVFRVRLNLTALDLDSNAPPHATDKVIKRLAEDVLRSEDAHAARDLLNHPAIQAEHHRPLTQLIKASGLGQGHLPDPARKGLSLAIDSAETVLHSAYRSGRPQR